MPSPFTITALTPGVVLDSERRGEASYKVTNIIGRDIRGRARLVPEGSTQAAWLTLEGEIERDFAVGEEQEFTIGIAASQDAAPGEYSFRLDMVGVENPDELYSRGEEAAFEVSEHPAPPPPEVRKGYLRTVAGGAIGGLSGITLGIILGLLLGSLFQSGDFAVVVGAIVIVLGTGVGCWVALNTGEYPWPVETAVVTAVFAALGTVLDVFVLRAQSWAFGCILFIAILFIPPLIARVIILVWKTGRP